MHPYGMVVDKEPDKSVANGTPCCNIFLNTLKAQRRKKE
jgi:hypothetical protein